jgi:hypothetical protein
LFSSTRLLVEMPSTKEELESYVGSLTEIAQLAGRDPVLAKELLLAVRAAVGEDNIVDMLDVGPSAGDDCYSTAETPERLPRRFYSPPKPALLGDGSPHRSQGGSGAASQIPNVEMETSMMSGSMSMSRVNEDDAEKAARVKKLRRQSAAYPACLLLTLDTVHNVDEALRWSVGDLDRAVKEAEDDVRRLRAELRNQEALFEKLQPTSSYIDRDTRSILEQIAEEEKTTMNERGVLREQVAAKIDERHAARHRVRDLTSKLEILRKHAAIVKASVTEDYEHLVATYPHLTEKELHLSSHDINLLMEQRRVQIRETKQLLLKGRVKREHAMQSLGRQVAEKEEILAQRMAQLGDDGLGSPLLAGGEGGGDVASIASSASSTPPQNSASVVLPPLALTPQPAKSTSTHSHFDRPSPQHAASDSEELGGLRRATSLALLKNIRTKALERMAAVTEQRAQHAIVSSPQLLSPAKNDSVLHSSSPARSSVVRERSLASSTTHEKHQRSAKDPQTLVMAEAEARKQVHNIFRDSLALLEKDFEIESLRLQEKMLLAQNSSSKQRKLAVGHTPGRKRP